VKSQKSFSKYGAPIGFSMVAWGQWKSDHLRPGKFVLVLKVKKTKAFSVLTL